MGIHARTHPVYVEGCTPCRWSTIKPGNWATSPAGERQIINNLMAEAEIDRYRDLRRQGVQPRGTRWKDLDEAERASEAAQEPFRADVAALDPSRDWGDGGGTLELAAAPVEGREPVTVEVSG